MSGASIRFTEVMSGHVAFGEHDYERAATAGRAAANRVRVRLTIEIDDLGRFAADVDREARIAGWVEWEAVGGRLPVERGVFNLLVGAEGAVRKEMRYRLFFRDGVGHPVTLAGEKLVGAAGLRVWSDTTTLYVRALSGHVAAEEEAARSSSRRASSACARSPSPVSSPASAPRGAPGSLGSGRSPASMRCLPGSSGRPTGRRQYDGSGRRFPPPRAAHCTVRSAGSRSGERRPPDGVVDRDAMVTPPKRQDLQRRAVRPNGVRRLPDDTLLVFFSDGHIGGDPGHDIFESPDELTALLKELAGVEGPVELVLAGDFFDFLEIGETPTGENRASSTVARPEYQELFATLRRFAAGSGRHVVYMPGNHDAEMWWNPAIGETLRREGLVHELVLSYAACFASAPDRVVYCEHGNQFDPANAITDYDDRLDTPLGQHMVTDVTRRIVAAGEAQGNEALRDINKVYPSVAIPQLLAGRLFYDLLTRVVRCVLGPLFLAYLAIWTLVYVIAARDDQLSFWRSLELLPGGQQLLTEIGFDTALLLLAFGLFFLVIRGQTRRVLASTATRLPGVDQAGTSSDRIHNLLDSSEPMPMNGELTGRDVAVFVSGHTHAPSLTEVPRDGGGIAVAVNSGCWLRQVWPVRAHFGAPAVFVSTFVLTHVRVYLDQSGVRAELWEHPKPSEWRLHLAERLATLGRLPPLPAPATTSRIATAISLPGATPAKPPSP